MNKDKIVTLFKNLPKLDNLSGGKFAYFVAKNISATRSEVEALEAILKNSKEYDEYEEERVALALENAETDDKGKPKIIMNQQMQTEYVMKDPLKWIKEFKALNKKHKKVLDAKQKQLDEYNEMLKEESDVKLHRIKMEHVPANISVAQMNIIVDLIDDAE